MVDHKLNKIVKTFIKAFLPNALLKKIQKFRRELYEKKFANQATSIIQIGDYKLRAPRSHILIELSKTQPLRDACVGITAKFMGIKYPHSCFIDIGANIGETAAQMAMHASNNIVLVEPSPIYANLLRQNITAFPINTEVIEALVGNGKPIRGELNHWGGTAYLHETKDTTNNPELPTLTLSGITNQQSCIIKIDTDGHDFNIILSNIEWLGLHKPALLYENTIRNSHELDQAQQTIEALAYSGYTHFIVWDDPGRLIISTKNVENLQDLNRFLAISFEADATKRIWNYDILCLGMKDSDVHARITNWFRKLPYTINKLANESQDYHSWRND